MASTAPVVAVPMPDPPEVVYQPIRKEWDPQQEDTKASIRAKEEAWERWYTLPKECERMSDENLVECGNRYIRARQKFERLYAQGKIR